jgi:hypothetical protein
MGEPTEGASPSPACPSSDLFPLRTTPRKELLMHAQRAKYEAALGRARRELTRAYNAACDLGDQGAEADLAEMSLHCSELMRSSFKELPHRQIPGQLRLDVR